MKNYKYKVRTTGRSFKTKKDIKAEQKFRLEVFMGWMPDMSNNEPYFPRTSYFEINFGSHSRRTSTMFHALVFNKIVKAKSMNHMKLTLSNLVRKKNYRKKL